MNITHIRAGKVIRRLAFTRKSDGKAVPESAETYKSINAAKRASRQLQKSDEVSLRVGK